MILQKLKVRTTILLLFIVGLLLLGWSGKLLPPASSKTSNLPYSADFLEISRPWHFPPREIHSEACGLGMLLDWLCWGSDPTFNSAGKTGLAVLQQGGGEAQFISVNRHFKNEHLKDQVIVLKVEGKTREFSITKSKIVLASFSKPEPIARIDKKFCFSADLDRNFSQNEIALICVDLESAASIVEIANTNQRAAFQVVLDEAGAERAFCDGQASMERLFGFLLNRGC